MISLPLIHQAKVLIVDDQASNVAVLDGILRNAGYTLVSSTRDPRAVCALHRDNKYDLILLDLEMPKMDGFEVMEALKAVDQDGFLPVLVITGQPEHKLKALQTGARDFLTKPFEAAEVLMRAQNLIELRLLHRASLHLYQQVLAEQEVSKSLLLNVLPESVEDLRRAHPKVLPDCYMQVTLLFAELVSLTQLSGTMEPGRGVTMLGELFALFDAIAKARGLVRIATLGDAYMAVAGSSEPRSDHAEAAAHMALDMLDATDRYNLAHKVAVEIRIGLHSGPVVAGVLGIRPFTYNLWNDATVRADEAPMHDSNARILVTEATRRRLSAPFRFAEHGLTVIKGNDEKNTWYLTGRQDRP